MGLSGAATADRAFAVLTASVGLLFLVSMAFAAFALYARVRNDRTARREIRLVDRWEPYMLEVLAGVSPDAALLGRVGPREGTSFVTFLLGYARRLRGEEGATVRRLAAPFLPKIAESMGRGPAEKRALAVHQLAEVGMPGFAGAVARALEDRSTSVAMIAARGLFRRGQARYFPAVLAQLPRFTHSNRTFLAGLLAGGGPEAAPLLREILADTKKPLLVRAVAADALRLLNDLPSVPHAVAGLTSLDRELVVSCLRLIRQLGHVDQVEHVRPLLASPDPVIRAAAAGALGAIGGPEEVPQLQDALDDHEYWVSLEAARGLMSLGDVETLRRLAESPGPWSVLARQVLDE